MIGGQQLDLEGGRDLERVNRLKTGALFSASVMCGLRAAEVRRRAPAVARVRSASSARCFSSSTTCWTATARCWTSARSDAPPGRRCRRAGTGTARVDPGDTAVLAGIVSGLAARTA